MGPSLRHCTGFSASRIHSSNAIFMLSQAMFSARLGIDDKTSGNAQLFRIIECFVSFSVSEWEKERELDLRFPVKAVQMETMENMCAFIHQSLTSCGFIIKLI